MSSYAFSVMKSQRRITSLNAGAGDSKALTLVKKKKMKDVEALQAEIKEEGGEHYIQVSVF